MTTKEKIIKMLVDRGMSDQQANAVLELTIPVLKKAAPHYEFTLDRPAEEYPQAIYNIVFHVMKPIALKWIIENVPEAWFRAAFNN